MFFGLTNAPATFVCLIDQTFGDIKRVFCSLYMDDFSIFSKTYDEHLRHEDEFLRKLQNAGLKIKSSECASGKTKGKFLSHEVFREGIAPDQKKLRAILGFPAPHN